MPETRTDLILTARERGFTETGARAQRMGQTASRAMTQVDRAVTKLETSFQKLARQQVDLVRQMQSVGDKASPAYQKLAKDLDGVQREASRVERTMRSLKRAFSDTGQEARKAANEARGSFRQGFLQGAVPGAQFVQRGPGMARQAAGAFAGRAVRGVAGGLAATPFTGAQGIAQALQSLPGGGFLAMPLMQSMAYAQQAVQFRQQRQELAPFLGGMQMQRTMGRAGRRARLGAAEEARSAFLGRTQADVEGQIRQQVEGRIQERATAAAEAAVPKDVPFWRNRAQDVAAQRVLQLKRVREEEGDRISYRVRVEAGDRNRAEAEKEAKRAGRAAAGRGRAQARRRFLGDIQGVGLEMGYAAPQAQQMAGALVQAGGGFGRELRSQQMLPAAFAAQRMYGIGPEVAGAFLQGGRRGGVVGGRGRGGEAMVDALSGAVRMGLEGTELNQYMAQMANDIRSWQQTGIPVNTESTNAIGRAMGRMGMGAVRGGVMAQAIGGRARELSARGPQGAEELVMLQELGGFKGGGVEQFEEAQLRLERGEFSPEDLQRMMGRFMAAGGEGAGGRTAFRRAMGRMGVRVGVQETRLLEKGIRGGEYTAAEQQQLAEITTQMRGAAARAPGSVGEMRGMAAGMVDPVMRRQAAMTNQQIATGNKMIGMMQNLEKTTRNVTDGFATLAGEPLTKLTAGIKELSDEIPKMSEKARAFISGDVTALFAGNGGD